MVKFVIKSLVIVILISVKLAIVKLVERIVMELFMTKLMVIDKAIILVGELNSKPQKRFIKAIDIYYEFVTKLDRKVMETFNIIDKDYNRQHDDDGLCVDCPQIYIYKIKPLIYFLKIKNFNTNNTIK